MDDPQPHPPPQAPSPPQAQPPPRSTRGTGGAGLATASLVAAVLAPFTIVGTLPAGALFNVAAYYLGAPTHVYRWQPLIVLGLPVLSGLLSVALALVSLKGAAPRSPNRASAVAALCINAVIFILGLFFTMPHLRYWLFG